MTEADDQLCALANHLHAARTGILQAWQASVAQDPQLTTASTISRAQFNDHVPQILEAFERRLRAHDPGERHQARVEQRENAAEHGLHRWQLGYDQRETMREWGHLHICVLRELETYARNHRSLEESVMPTARAALVRLCAEGVCESATRYERLQQAEAASRVGELKRALQDLQVLEQQRAEVWREAAHDLRGTVSVITSASAVLTGDNDPGRERISHILQRNVKSLRELLGDLMDLARLEAGQERFKLAPFDAGHLLKEFCDSIRDVAAERNLFLKTEGPVSLPVEGDAIKVRRIVQNLVLNSIKATSQGGVRVTWQKAETSGAEHWMVCVQDTGPGLDRGHAAPLERVLNQATVASQGVEVRALLSGDEANHMEPAPTLPSKSDTRSDNGGEGIGLSIVKRLCELLDASLELQTAPGTGTTFRVIFPQHYKSAIIRPLS